MKFRVRYSKAAKEDMRRLYAFLIEIDPQLARRARDAIAKGLAFLEDFPFTCRKAAASPFLREFIISFGSAGYVALYEIEDNNTVTILAIRHQREDDYH